jgi:hypothetical protein
VIRDIAESELSRESQGETEDVRFHLTRGARKMAELLFPDLPWKDSEVLKIKAFVDELEALSRKHKRWIIGTVPGTLPLITDGEDDEGGYELGQTANGAMVTINRYFPKD